MKILNTFLLSLLMFGSSILAQPANDNCADAFNISLGETCNLQGYTSISATAESIEIAANPSCGLYRGGDVWFKFTVPASGDFRVQANTEWTLYTGSCGDFTEFDCNNGNMNYRHPELAGETIYLRAFRFNNASGGDFSLCIWEPEMQPNDYCADAITLNVGQECNLQAFSSQFTTAESTEIAANPSCGLYRGGDVWFKFTVPASGDFRVQANTQWTLYTGICGDFTEFVCNSGNMNYRYPELAGETIYLRAFQFNNRNGGDFSICIWEPEMQPNDYCADAIDLDLQDYCEIQSYSTRYATSETIEVVGEPSCGLYQGGDVWFRFTAPISGQFSIQRLSHSGGAPQFSFYTGSCGSLIDYECSGAAEINFNAPELGGELIYLRVHTFNNRNGSDFEFCIKNTSIAENDHCADAISLNVGQSCEFQTFNNYNTTQEDEAAPVPSCRNFMGGDVWFTFTVPETGQFKINKNNIKGNFSYSLYSGICGEMTEIDCLNNSSQSLHELPELAGETLFLRVYQFNSVFGGEFELCIVAGDCNAELGGTAYLDDCGICVGGSTELEPCEEDCHGDFGGTAYIDDCQTCVGGNTGLVACEEDCHGEYGGDAFLDDCDICVGGNTGLEACVFDCDELQANIGDACDDGDDMTENDMIDENCECVGTPIITYDCPELEANFGDACDDGDDMTENDTINENCECEGTPVAVVDTDGDGIPDDIDNCPFVYNPGQEDTDNDGIGDHCAPCGIPYDIQTVRTGPTTAIVTAGNQVWHYQGSANRAGRPLRPYPMYGMNDMVMPYTHQNLVPAFEYDTWFRTICDDGSFSAWVGPYFVPTFDMIPMRHQVNMTLTPNPAVAVVNIGQINAKTIEVFDMNGGHIKTFTTNDNQFDLTGLPTGKYNLRVMDAEGNIHYNQVIKK